MDYYENVMNIIALFISNVLYCLGDIGENAKRIEQNENIQI